MTRLSAYWRLLRLDKPVGILLLWYPTAWALWIANQGQPALSLLCLFFMGTACMRSAGCVINDIADRNFDKHVARTKLRPLTAGEVSLPEAFVLLFICLLCSLCILIALPVSCFFWALVALIIAIVYPFCKRFLQTPQVVLGLAFSMGIPMAFSASGVQNSSVLAVLFCINFVWIVAYDTMYAMADKADDLKIGVKSTAIYFADYDRLIVALLLCFLHGGWLVLAALIQPAAKFYGVWLAAASVLLYQYALISQRNPNDCLKAFRTSSWYGAMMWVALL